MDLLVHYTATVSVYLPSVFKLLVAAESMFICASITLVMAGCC